MSNAAHQFQLNPVAPGNLLEPAPLYKELRQNDPLHWSEAAGAWFITRHADVLAGFRDSRLSTVPVGRGGTGGLEPGDGPGRLALRRRTALVFTFQSLDLWQRDIRPLARQLVARVRREGRVDAVEAVTRQLPPRVMAELLDLPEAQRPRFLECARLLADLQAPASGADEAQLARRAQGAVRELLELLGELVEERRQVPGGDLLSRLIHGPGSGEGDPAGWVPRTALCLLAEHAISAELLGNALNELLVHPEQLRRLRADGSLLRGAVEEVLRFSPAVPFAHRVATETFTWQGRLVRRGDEVFLGLAAANRDPCVVSEPERFDITRDPYAQRHLSFGFGAHHHLCAGLLRRELETLLEVVLEELPHLRLDAERLPQLKCHSLLFRGFETLPVRA